MPAMLLALANPHRLRINAALASGGRNHACLLVVIIPFVVPWRYVVARNGLQPGERWC